MLKRRLREQIIDDIVSCIAELLACVEDSNYDRRLNIGSRQVGIVSDPEWNGDTGCVTLDLASLLPPSVTNIAALLDDDVLQLISRRLGAEVTASLRLHIYHESWVLM